MRKVLSMLIVLSMLFILVISSQVAFAESADNSITLKVSFAEAQGDPKYDAMEAFKEYVEKESEGSITIELYPSNELGSNNDVGELVKNGANVILSNAADGIAPYGNPNFTAIGIFYTFQSAEEVNIFTKTDLYQEMCGVMEGNGVKILSMNWVTTPRQLMSVEPLYHYEDLKDVLVRVPAATYSTFFAATGASPVSMTFSDVYSGLSSKLIEAVEAPLGTLVSYSLQEVAKYVEITNHCLAPALLCMNNDLYSSLSENQQKVLSEGSAYAGDIYTALCAEKADGFRQVMEEAGVTFIEWDEADYAKMAEAAQEVYAAYPEMDADIYSQIMTAIGK